MIQHLFFDCQFTQMIWATVYSAWGLSKPRNISNMFGSWLNRIPKHYKSLVLVGTATLCWSVWLCRNTVVFDNKKSYFCRLSTQLRTGSLHRLSFRIILCRTSLQRLLIFWHRWPRIFFVRAHGWRSSLRIDSHQCGRIFIKLFLGYVSFRQRSGKFQNDVSP